MKAKKIVIGAVSAAMLSLSVCSIAPVFAAGETVQISVGKVEVKAGETFSVDVSLASVPATGIQNCDFAIKYDSSVIKIDSVEAGEIANTAAIKDDPSAAMLSIFNSSIDNTNGRTSLVWTTSLDDPSYWMNKDGVFCTLTGTVAEGAKDGSVSLEIVPTSRNTYPGSGAENEVISIGYFKNKDAVRYDVTKTNGAVVVNNGGGNGSTGKGLKGDANEDGTVNISDAVTIMQILAAPGSYSFKTDQGKINADVNEDGGVTAMDALEIQLYDMGSPSALD